MFIGAVCPYSKYQDNNYQKLYYYKIKALTNDQITFLALIILDRKLHKN